MPTEYAHALSQSLTGVTDKREAQKRVDTLLELLQKSGKVKALPAILREFKRIQARSLSRKATLSISNEKQKNSALKDLEKRLGEKPTEVSVLVNDTLVGGWRYLDNDTLIDTSHKAALLELYRRVTAI